MPALFPTAGDTLTAAQYNLLPRGVVGYATQLSSQGSITTEVDLTGLTVTWTAVAGRLYRASFRGPLSSTVGTDRIQLKLTTSANTQLASQVMIPNQTSNIIFSSDYFGTPSAGSTTWKLRALRATGSGTVTMGASATDLAHLLIEDVGAA
jgi:hypothetical protein